jgi:hypothetical protein
VIKIKYMTYRHREGAKRERPGGIWARDKKGNIKSFADKGKGGYGRTRYAQKVMKYTGGRQRGVNGKGVVGLGKPGYLGGG